MYKQRYGVLKNDEFINFQLLEEGQNDNIKYNYYVLVEETYNRNQNGNGKVTFLDKDNSLLSLRINNWKLNPNARMMFDWQGFVFYFEFIDPKGQKKELNTLRAGVTKFSHPHLFDEELKFAFEKLKELSIYPDWRYNESLEKIKELEEENEELKKEIDLLKAK